MESTTVGIDLAKQVFSVCVMNEKGHVTQRLELKRDSLADWLRQRPAGTVVAMEACSSAHHWARFCMQNGLVPRLMAAQFVKPFARVVPSRMTARMPRRLPRRHVRATCAL